MAYLIYLVSKVGVQDFDIDWTLESDGRHQRIQMITTVWGPSSPPEKAVKEGRRAPHLNSERVPSSSLCLPSSAEQTSTASTLALAVSCVSHKICIWAITILLGVVKPAETEKTH